jgi:hypothetical protein
VSILAYPAYLQDRASTFLRNVGELLEYAALHARRPQTSDVIRILITNLRFRYVIVFWFLNLNVIPCLKRVAAKYCDANTESNSVPR